MIKVIKQNLSASIDAMSSMAVVDIKPVQVSPTESPGTLAASADSSWEETVKLRPIPKKVQ